MQSNLLSILIWLPIVAGILILATGGDERAPIARKLALGFSIAVFILCLPLYTGFDYSTAAMQFVEHGVELDRRPSISITIPWVSTASRCR